MTSSVRIMLKIKILTMDLNGQLVYKTNKKSSTLTRTIYKRLGLFYKPCNPFNESSCRIMLKLTRLWLNNLRIFGF